MIRETIITTLNEDDSVHIAPMGIRKQEGLYIIAPFKPSTTLQNLQRSQQAVINFTDDVRIFAGCLTGRYDWPTVKTDVIKGQRLQSSLSHVEIEVSHLEEDEIRPRFFCSVKHEVVHQPFTGLNRAKAAVLEAAILVSRLDMLPAEKIETEIDYLKIAIDKTAGVEELEAWGWLMERIQDHNKQGKTKEGAA